jgi:DNA-binding protein H-NS
MTMPTYQEYQKQIAELGKLAEQARQQEILEARKKIQALLNEYGLTSADLEEVKKPVKKQGGVEAKYRDTETGKTWSGRGRAPRWLDGKNREDYLIK